MRDDQSDAEIAALAQRVATARGKLPLQTDPALFEELSESEIAAERDLAEWIRSQRRQQRRRAVSAELAAEKRDRRVALALRRSDDADARWHRKALAARRRVSNPDARLAQLYRRAEWSSRALIGVVVLGMVWAGVNVQHNLVPSGDMSDPLYWLSYGFEAMISIPIITIMVVATTAARWGREIARGKVVFLEAALLGVTIALNAGPHLAAGAPARAAEAAVAPVMVGVVIWLHAWVSARYAQLIDAIPTHSATTPPGRTVTHSLVDAFTSDHPEPIGPSPAANGGEYPTADATFPSRNDEPHPTAEFAEGSGTHPVHPQSPHQANYENPTATTASPPHNEVSQPHPEPGATSGPDPRRRFEHNGSDYPFAHAGRLDSPPVDINPVGESSHPRSQPVDTSPPADSDRGRPQAVGGNRSDGLPMGERLPVDEEVEYPTADAGFPPRNGRTRGAADRPGETSAHPGRVNNNGHNGFDPHNGHSRNGHSNGGDIPIHPLRAERNGVAAGSGERHSTPERNVNGHTDEWREHDSLGFEQSPTDTEQDAAEFTQAPVEPGNAAAEPYLPGTDSEQPRTTERDRGGSPRTHDESHRRGDDTHAEHPIARRPDAAAERVNGEQPVEPGRAVAEQPRRGRSMPRAHDEPRNPGNHTIAEHPYDRRPAAGRRSAPADGEQVEPSADPVPDGDSHTPGPDRGESQRTETGRGSSQANDDSRRRNGNAAGDRPHGASRPSAAAESGRKPQARKQTRSGTQLALDEPAPVDVSKYRRPYAVVDTEPAAAEEDSPDTTTDHVDLAAEIDNVGVWAVAREISERRLSKLPVEQLAEILTLADESWTPAAIGASVGLPGSRILGILDTARRIRRPYAVSG